LPGRDESIPITEADRASVDFVNVPIPVRKAVVDPADSKVIPRAVAVPQRAPTARPSKKPKATPTPTPSPSKHS